MGKKSDSRIIVGVHAVQAALGQEHGSVHEVWMEQGARNKRVIGVVQEAEQLGVPVHRVSRNELEKLVRGEKHQGIAARCDVPSARGEGELLELVASRKDVLLLVLDGVQDPHNLGACLRSCDAAGADAIVIPKSRATGLTPTVCRVASGAAETVPVFQVSNLARCLRALQDQAVWIIGTAGDAKEDLYTVDLKGSIALILGAEGEGMRRLTREHCDVLMKIPMVGRVESLNVSVAAGVCLFEARRQRSQ